MTTQPLLSVVAPVHNGSAFIQANVAIIREELDAAGVPYELIVVSDGSVDTTVELALAAGSRDVRVFHYDRNVGKGYAVKLGLLSARGRYVGFIDSDLDLHPSELPRFLAAIQTGGLDAVIGSKRHPDSQVDYPTRRRVYSWFYQQLVRLLFRLDVRDTQVGIKLFRRELVDDVVPHLLVKRYAFDLELLAVARALGYSRIQEQPIRLDYAFTGSGIRPLAIAQALWDTAAIFYRLRILRYYDRRIELVGEHSKRGAQSLTTLVAIVGDASDEEIGATQRALGHLEHPPTRIEVQPAQGMLADARLAILENASEDLVAFIRPGVIPATNWLGALLACFASPQTVAVGGPVLPDSSGGIAEAASAAVYESRFAAGPAARRHLPGNIRETVDQSVDNLLVRRAAALDSGAFHAAAENANDSNTTRDLARVGRVIFVPDAPVVAKLPPLLMPLLTQINRHAQARGRAIAFGGATPVSTIVPAAFAIAVVVSPLLAFSPAWTRRVATATVATYSGGLGYATLHAGLRQRSVRVAAAFAAAAPASHLAYGAGLLMGISRAVRRPRAARSTRRG